MLAPCRRDERMRAHDPYETWPRGKSSGWSVNTPHAAPDRLLPAGNPRERRGDIQGDVRKAFDGLLHRLPVQMEPAEEKGRRASWNKQARCHKAQKLASLRPASRE